LLDFPFHTKEFFPTKIFWPFSNFSVDGISWATPEVWLTNLSFLLVFFFWRFKDKVKSKL
jgi:hypothetical protein